MGRFQVLFSTGNVETPWRFIESITIRSVSASGKSWCNIVTQMLHVWYIYLYIWVIFEVNVGNFEWGEELRIIATICSFAATSFAFILRRIPHLVASSPQLGQFFAAETRWLLERFRYSLDPASSFLRVASIKTLLILASDIPTKNPSDFCAEDVPKIPVIWRAGYRILPGDPFCTVGIFWVIFLSHILHD